VGTHGRIGERLRHHGIPYVPTGRMGDVLVFGGVNVYPFAESLLLNAISSALLGIDLS
jgi:hypothetical protein